MKKIIQNLRDGETKIIDAPIPNNSSNNILIKSTASLISTGTEKMLTDFGSSNWYQRVKKNPDKVKQVINKIKTDGIVPTFESVNNKLDQPIELGYCNVGIIQEIGSNVRGYSIGDRVISNGSHSEYNSVPVNLTCRVPVNVSDEEAAFTVMGAIALHGIRLAKLSIGEKVVVIGMGIIGLITTQILIKTGHKVLCIDIDQNRLDIAKSFGAEVHNSSNDDFLYETAEEFSNSNGVDAVFITSTSNSDQIIHDSAEISRKRGRIILIGVTGLNLDRSDFYEKELVFQVSCSYGPGRYDVNYELDGNDYPIGYVRWTERRNFECILEMISNKTIILDKLISRKINFENALDAYEDIKNSRKFLGVIFKYKKDDNQSLNNVLSNSLERKINYSKKTNASIGIIGAGNFTSKVILPNLKYIKNIELNTIISKSGLSSNLLMKKYSFINNSTNSDFIFDNKKIDTVFITSRHDSHSKFICNALKTNKNIFVEKPMAINNEQLEEIRALVPKSKSKIFVDFNRRFSPHIKKMKTLISKISIPKAININVNSGMIDKDHWTQDLKIGGGRIIGEVCHFIDLALFLSGSKIKNWNVVKMKSQKNDTLSISFEYENGSIATINYFSNGNSQYHKENIEVFIGNKILKLDNFKKLRGYGWNNFKSMNLWSQDKGHKNAINEFITSCMDNHDSPILFQDLYDVTKVSIDISNKINKS